MLLNRIPSDLDLFAGSGILTELDPDLFGNIWVPVLSTFFTGSVGTICVKIPSYKLSAAEITSVGTVQTS